MKKHVSAVGPSFILMGDNVHPHSAVIIDDFLESKGFVYMEWPAYLPDLNQI